MASSGSPRVVLYLIGGHRFGGMEVHLLHVLEHLDRRRFQPSVICVSGSPAYLARLKDLGVPHENLRMGSIRRPRNLFRLLSVFPRTRRLRPDLVHTYGLTCDVIGPALRLMMPRLRVLTTRRGEDRSRRHQKMRSWANRWAHRVVCVSEETRAFTRRTEDLHAAEATVLANGVPIPKAEAPRAERTRIRFGTLGTIKPIKGTDLLIDAFLRFEPEAECELHVAGGTDRDPRWASELMERVEASPLADRAQFFDHLTDAFAFLRSIDVFVLPSRSEGMSNALLEAMSAGLPSVVTRVGSNASVVERPDLGLEAGIVCEPDGAELHAAMAKLLDDRSLRERLGRDALELVRRNHSLDGMVRNLEALYDDVLSRS